MQLGEGELRVTVIGDEHMQLALFGAHLGDVDVELADQVGLELLLGRPISLDIGQAADAVALQAATTVSDPGLLAARRKDSHPTATVCCAGRRR